MLYNNIARICLACLANSYSLSLPLSLQLEKLKGEAALRAEIAEVEAALAKL